MQYTFMKYLAIICGVCQCGEANEYKFFFIDFRPHFCKCYHQIFHLQNENYELIIILIIQTFKTNNIQ